MHCNRCGRGTSAGCKNVPCEFPNPASGGDISSATQPTTSSRKTDQPDTPVYTSTPINVGEYADPVKTAHATFEELDSLNRAQGIESDHAGWFIDKMMGAERERNEQKSKTTANTSSGGKVGPVVAFVAAAAVVLGIKSCMSDAPPSRTTAHTADSSSPVYEPAGQRAPLITYVKPDGQPVRMWADFQKSQLRVTIPDGACIEVLDKDHAFGMSSVTIQYNSGRYEHGLIEQTAKVKPAPECNNTMR